MKKLHKNIIFSLTNCVSLYIMQFELAYASPKVHVVIGK